MNAPTERVRRLIAMFNRSNILVVRIFCQCWLGQFINVSVSSMSSSTFLAADESFIIRCVHNCALLVNAGYRRITVPLIPFGLVMDKLEQANIVKTLQNNNRHCVLIATKARYGDGRFFSFEVDSL